MKHILFCIVNTFTFSKSRETCFWNVLIDLNGANLKKPFTPNSSNKNDFYRQISLNTFFCLYMWAKYEPIWTDFTAQTVILRANMIVQAQTIPQKASAHYVFYPKLRLLKIPNFWRGLRFFRCGWFAILKFVKTFRNIFNLNHQTDKKNIVLHITSKQENKFL